MQAGPQVGSRAGDGAVGQLGHAAAKPRVLTAQLEPGSLRLTGAAAGIGDQHHPVTEHGEGETDGSGVDMVTVANDLSLNARGLHRGGNDAGVAVVDGGHGVVQVGQVGDTGVDGGSGVVIVGIGVGDGDGTQLLGLGDKFRRAGQFGRDIHDADKTAAALVQLLEALKIRVLQVVWVLCAALLVGEVGPLHLNAHETGQSLGGCGVELLRGGEGFFQHVVGQGHGGGGKGGHAALGIESGHPLESLVIAVGEVRAGVAVAVDVDQAGDDGRAV